MSRKEKQLRKEMNTFEHTIDVVEWTAPQYNHQN